MNIFEKMSAITSEITAVAKNLNVGWGKNQYKAVGEADVLAAVKPIEAKHKVYSYPVDREIVETAILTTVKPDGTESKQQFMRVRTVYRFVDIEKPSDFIDIATYGDGVDSQDKAPGKAMTYADKYALLKAYKIITGDDPDQNYSEPLKDKAAKSRVPVQQLNPKAKIGPDKVASIRKLMEGNGLREDYVCKQYGIKDITELNEGQHAGIVKNMALFIQKQKEADETK